MILRFSAEALSSLTVISFNYSYQDLFDD